jgi:hypothetical protein
MDLPADTSLPFFTYGLFRPGQIGFQKLREDVAGHTAGWSISGRVKERDGLPVLLEARHDSDEAEGTLIEFIPARQKAAYQSIADIEPEELYRWVSFEARKGPERRMANVLLGRSGDSGSHDIEYLPWDGSRDLLFTKALEVVQEVLDLNREFDWEPKPTLHLQMAYMLLWSAIERFASFKYHLGKDVTAKVKRLADEPAVRATLLELSPEPRRVVHSTNPGKKETLKATDPKKAIAYYYQLRSNVVHRGKSAPQDHEKLVKSLEELLTIFRRVLEAEFRID